MDVVIQSRDSRSSPDQSRWGTNLDSLLDDSDGVEFFNKFLSYKHSASHLLDFWFACKGFRSNVDLSNPEKLFQVAKVIYRTYIKSGASHAVPLPYLLKQNINDCLSSYHHGYKKGFASDGSILPPDRCMFDPAQNVIKNLLEQKYYPEFLAFISCPVNLLSITSNEHICCERKTSNKYLEILYSDQKLDGCRTDRSKQNSFHRSNRLSADQFTDSAMLEPTGNNVVDIPTLKQDCGHDENKQRTTNQSRLTNPLPSHETSQTVPESSTSLQTPRNPNYPNLSSGLVYDNQSSNVLKESYPSKLHPPVRKQTNLAESDPVSFVQLLTDRLEKVRESRGKVEKLMSLVNQVDGKLCIESGHTSVSVSASHELFSSTVVGHNPSLQSNDSNWCQLDTTIISPMNPPVNETNSIPLTQHAIHPSLTDDAKQLSHLHESALSKMNINRQIYPANKSQDAQEILDDHCSRIWADELERDKKRCRRQLSDCSRTSANQLSSVTPYPILSDTLVRSMHASLVRNTTDYELMKPSSGRCKTTATARSTVTCFSNTSNNNRTSVSDSSHRRRHAAGGYRGMNRPNKSDVRSTASWDSGVVTSNYEMKNLHLTDTDGDNDYFDAETSSILEAASLQALSSSTTELALVNGEVTAKLVEKMIRHYPRRTFDRDAKHSTNTQSAFNSSQRRKETFSPSYEYSQRLERKQQQSGHFYEQPSYIQGFNSNSAYGPTCQHCANKISCEWHRLRHCVHHCSTQPGANEHLSSQLPIMSNYICSHQSVDKSMPSSSCHSQSFPTASDTSSTFDSGISSAYDQLPLRKQTSARENRSQSLHNWQMNNIKLNDTSVPTPRGNRTHSASKSIFGSISNPANNSITYPQTDCLISSCYEFNSKQPLGNHAHCLGNRLNSHDDSYPMHHYYHHHCPEMRRMMTSNDLNQHNVSECKKPSNGKLLQHWLQLQQHPTEKKSSLCPTTEEGQDNKPVSSENIPPVDRYSRSQVNKLVCKESHGRKSHHHHHHNHHHHSHSHRKTSAQRTNSNNTNPKHSSHTNTESNSCRQHSDEDDDDDDNMTTSARLDRKLSSSSSSAAAAMTNVHQQQTSHINPTTTPVSSSGPQGLVVGYYLCDDPVPYRTVWTGPPTSGSHSSNNNNNSNNNNQSSSSSSALFVEVSDHSETVDNYQTKQLTSQSLLTLGQFKQLIAKKGVYRYFFKKPNDEFGTGVVHEELTNDDSILPLWEGKVVARVERAD